MERFITAGFNISITKEELLETLKIVDDPKDENYKVVTEMLEEALNCANPKFVHCVASIEEKGEDYVIVEGHKLTSALVREKLDKVHRIIPFVATCGTEAETWSHRYTDMLEHYWADEIKKLILRKCSQFMKDTVRAQLFPIGYMSTMNPGSLPQWPITEQTTLFSLIGNVREDIGVNLTDTCLMIPSKSISGFFFSSETYYENCQLCPMLKCPNRRAEYIK
jgi:hypothetical protein